MDIDFTITGQRIREARVFRGWTAEILAEKIGLATESLRHIENASSKPSLHTLFRIATHLDVSLDYLTGRSQEFSAALAYEHFGLTKEQEQLLQEMIKNIIPIVTKYI